MNLKLGCATLMQAAHEAECASLKAATQAAEEHSRDLQSRHEAEMDERNSTIAELRADIEEMQARAAALEANLGEHLDTTAAPQLSLHHHDNSSTACCPTAFELPSPLLYTMRSVTLFLCVLFAGEIQACAEAAAERVTFLEEQIAGLNADADKAAKDAKEALAAAQAEAASQLAALHTQHNAAVAELQSLLSVAQVRTCLSFSTTVTSFIFIAHAEQP